MPGSVGGLTWAVSILLAFATIPIHFLGRLVKMQPEFKVSEKRIQKDMEKLRKRAEKK